MQTFLPFPDFAESAECLDWRRLGKQRLECLWIMQALMLDKGPVNHPATLMWRRYEWYLLKYSEAICNEWVSRGYTDNLLPRIQRLYYENCKSTEQYLRPPWLNSRKLHQAHQYKLLMKDPEHYYPYFGDVGKIEFFYPDPEFEFYPDKYKSAQEYVTWKKSDVEKWARGWNEMWMDRSR